MAPAFHGVRVLELGQIYNGPYCGLLLAQLGADVIKIEPPGGEQLRFRSHLAVESHEFVMLNSTKRSVVLDLKTDAGRQALLDLVATADVLIENYAPGTMERLLEASITHARTRTQFGQAIGKFQAVSHRIVDMKVQVEAARLLTYRAASRLGHTRTVSMDAAMAKLFVSESLVQTALAAVQVHGGYGYMTEFEVERALRDAVGSTIYSGTSEMQRNIIARWLGL